MSRLKKWSCSIVLIATSVLPVMADSNDAKPANENAANTASTGVAPAAASPSLMPTASDANVTALLGILVMKGVLAPTEANAIRNAAPDIKFQLLVEALSRKGLLSAADLAPANPAAPSTPEATPAAARETISSSLAS